MSESRPAESLRAVTCRIAFACELERVRPAVLSVRSFLVEQGCHSDDSSAVELALVEACNNAVLYAAAERRNQPVLVEALCYPEGIELRVTDHTPGFDWPTQINLPSPESEGGRGLYLIHELMHHANYFRGQEENILVMRRRRTGVSAVLDPTPGPSDLPECRRRLAENEQVIGQMIEELSSCYESLSAIFRYGAEQAETRNIKEFAERLLNDMLRILSADWFVVRVQPEGQACLEFFAASDPAIELVGIPFPSRSSETKLVEAVAASSRQDVWFSQRQPLAASDPLNQLPPHAEGLVHPCFLGGKFVATLAVGKERENSAPASGEAQAAFTAGQTNVIHTFGDLLAIQIVNARFQEQLINHRVVARELEIAKNIQRSLLPRTLPQAPGFSLAASCESASKVGGDFYDVLQVNEHSLLLVIADVMGKGVPAAMFAAILRTLLRGAFTANLEPAALLTRLNQILFPDLSGVDMFITVQLALVDAPSRRLTVASAGHCPLMLALPGESAARVIAPEGMPLGILPDTPFTNEAADLPPGVRALLYTDGLTEALNPAGERYGQERLWRWLHEQVRAAGDADALRGLLAIELAHFQQSSPPNDDQTFLLLAG